ncbi:MAG: hypothetical protein QG587_30 [Chloroflexota bacterium]|nr:hypothetical protein [Chloroflexota bacterium]
MTRTSLASLPPMLPPPMLPPPMLPLLFRVAPR